MSGLIGFFITGGRWGNAVFGRDDSISDRLRPGSACNAVHLRCDACHDAVWPDHYPQEVVGVGMSGHSKLMATDEGRILLAGMLLFGLYLAVIVVSGIFFADFYELIMAVTASHLIIGRVPGITVGYAMEASFLTVVGINFVIETMLVLFLYPLFIMSWNKLLDIGKLETWISGARQSAQKYQPVIKKYGLLGLFVFVWFPFWMTGPIVGSIIGYLLGFAHRVTLSVVLVGTFIAISCWGVVLQYLHKWAFRIDPKAPWVIVAILAALIVLGYLIRKLWKR